MESIRKRYIKVSNGKSTCVLPNTNEEFYLSLGYKVEHNPTISEIKNAFPELDIKEEKVKEPPMIVKVVVEESEEKKEEAAPIEEETPKKAPKRRKNTTKK